VNPAHIVTDALVSLHRDDTAFWTSDARPSSLEPWRHDRWHVLQYDVRLYLVSGVSSAKCYNPFCVVTIGNVWYSLFWTVPGFGLWMV